MISVMLTIARERTKNHDTLLKKIISRKILIPDAISVARDGVIVQLIGLIGSHLGPASLSLTTGKNLMWKSANARKSAGQPQFSMTN